MASPRSATPTSWRLGPDLQPLRRPKGRRRIFPRFEKLDVMFGAFLNLALVVDMIRR